MRGVQSRALFEDGPQTLFASPDSRLQTLDSQTRLSGRDSILAERGLRETVEFEEARRPHAPSNSFG
jgi:hypothetical protein